MSQVNYRIAAERFLAFYEDQTGKSRTCGLSEFLHVFENAQPDLNYLKTCTEAYVAATEAKYYSTPEKFLVDYYQPRHSARQVYQAAERRYRDLPPEGRYLVELRAHSCAILFDENLAACLLSRGAIEFVRENYGGDFETPAEFIARMEQQFPSDSLMGVRTV